VSQIVSSCQFRAGFALVLGVALAAQAPVRSGFPARLAEVEAIMDHFYRGPDPGAERRRVDALVDAFNAQVERRTADQEAARVQSERDRAAARALAAEVEARDRALGPAPAAGTEAARLYNERVAARNRLVRDCNAALAAARQAAAPREAALAAQDAELDRARARIAAERQGLKAREEAWEAFRAQGRDAAFFTALNRLLADLRANARTGPEPQVQAALAKVRGCRRELASWAAARQAEQANGLVLVPALVGDEPCCFIVDTGAQLVCLPRELIDALGLAGALGEEAPLVLAGGQKLSGRSITLPRVALAGVAATEVAGTVIPASEVGIDGLLGQSFLKRFVYTVDEARPGKLVLTPR